MPLPTTPTERDLTLNKGVELFGLTRIIAWISAVATAVNNQVAKAILRDGTVSMQGAKTIPWATGQSVGPPNVPGSRALSLNAAPGLLTGEAGGEAGVVGGTGVAGAGGIAPGAGGIGRLEAGPGGVGIAGTKGGDGGASWSRAGPGGAAGTFPGGGSFGGDGGNYDCSAGDGGDSTDDAGSSAGKGGIAQLKGGSSGQRVGAGNENEGGEARVYGGNGTIAGRVHIRPGVSSTGGGGVADVLIEGGSSGDPAVTGRVRFPQGVTITTEAALPDANEVSRGTLWLVLGGPGVADELRICTKDAADSYAFNLVTLT